jgi:hypothetical protein
MIPEENMSNWRNGVNRFQLTPSFPDDVTASTLITAEAEQVHQIADCGTIQWNVGVVRIRHWIAEIVAAAAG